MEFQKNACDWLPTLCIHYFLVERNASRDVSWEFGRDTDAAYY